MRDRVVSRERDPHLALLAGGDTDQLLLEAGNQAPAAKHNVAVLAARPGDLFAADPAFNVGDDNVAICRRAGNRLGLALLFGDPLQRGIDARLGDVDHQPLDPEVAEIGLGNLGQHLDHHLVFEIGALAERDDIDFGRQRRAQIAVADRVGRTVLNRAFDHLAQHRSPKPAAQDLQRHLARAKPRDAQGPVEFVKPPDDLVFELAGRDDDAKFVLEPLGAGLGHLHAGVSAATRGRSAKPTLIAFRLSVATSPLVRAGGFEPPRFSSLEPKSSASANSATPAPQTPAACWTARPPF